MANINIGRLLIIALGGLLGLGWVAPLLSINILTTVIPLINVKINELIAVALGVWAGTWVADQFPQTR